MKRVIRLSQAWIAALFLGLVLAGCGGGSSGGSQPSNSGQASQPSDGGNPGAVNRSAALSWNAPDERQNGVSLELYDVDYIINYGQDRNNLDHTVSVSSDQGDDYPPTLQYTVKDLSDGKWYFSVQAQDKNGLMSPPSEVVSKTI